MAQLSKERLEEIKEFGLARIIKPISDDEILSLVDIALAAEAQESAFKAAFEVWQDKTNWVQTDRRFDVLLPWGKHRADVLREYIERLERIVSSPQPVAVPDEMTMQKALSAINQLSWQECTRDAYMLGWNACRAAMLSAPQPESE